MSRLIIFDLETTEKYALGQIINLAAIAVNHKFEVIDKLRLDVSLSRTQLPSPEALLVNRTNLTKHKEIAVLNERQAIMKLFDFVKNQIDENRVGEVIIAGQNTSRFDLEFLRSNALRSGLYPYFSRVIYSDLIFLSKKLVLTNPEVRKLLTKEDGTISVSLEFLTNQLGVSLGKQTHDSLDDVMLTLEVFKHYAKNYDLNVFEYDAYEADAFHPKHGDVFKVATVEASKVAERMYALHWEDQKYALWLNVTDFKPELGKKNLWWKTKRNSSMIITERVKDKEIIERAKQMLNHPDVVDVDVDTYFDIPDCDPELHITTVKYKNIEAAVDYMNSGDPSKIKALENEGTPAHTNMLEFIKRNAMIYREGEVADKLLRSYALKRYSGKMKTQKFTYGEEKPYSAKHIDREVYHPSLKQRLATIETLLKEKTKEEDKEILLALKEHILSSDIVKLCPELL